LARPQQNPFSRTCLRHVFLVRGAVKAHQKENCRVKGMLGKPAGSLSGLPKPLVVTLADVDPDWKRIVACRQPIQPA
jgi:hypothetical protein